MKTTKIKKRKEENIIVVMVKFIDQVCGQEKKHFKIDIGIFQIITLFLGSPLRQCSLQS